ncbi:hypothetical protein [Mucilaginibacter sp.]|uniref:hypothetical protein n=1 Tax=Mucilaginibacter sp. TaxID=1882438 RepID=UPI002603B3C0|nr:hypothetical protein [Mucilaginibacter sp.]MDB5032235.1 hypothetical protein [Mucilaginibacter sp.]
MANFDNTEWFLTNDKIHGFSVSKRILTSRMCTYGFEYSVEIGTAFIKAYSLEDLTKKAEPVFRKYAKDILKKNTLTKD